jgi:uncharacterized protein involved in response to NO
MLRAMDSLRSATSSPPQITGWAPFALGFRPFFLLAAIAAVLLMVLWPAIWRGHLGSPSFYPAFAWHGHEMLFGYAAAVIAGFLLTAVRNWTGMPTWTGARLGLLALVWLLGRVLPWLPGVPAVLIIVVDVAFLPLVAISLFGPLWHGQNRTNRVFLPLLGAMGVVNLLSHLQLVGLAEGLGDPRRVMLDLVLMLIVIVAGRVLPFFTQNVVPGFRAKTRARVEQASFLTLGLIAFLELVPVLPAGVTGLLWLVFGAVQVARLSGWFDVRVFRIPVLWVLHAGYAWLCLGALLTGLSLFGLFPPPSALHAITVGGVGVFTLGMMARVARGHTGRPIDVPRAVAAAFVLANVAALIRVFGPALLPGQYALWVDSSVGLWVVSFGIFAWQYLPMLLRPRADGKPG